MTLTRVLGRARVARFPKTMVWVCTTALRFGDGPREGSGTGALLDTPVAGAANVGVHADSPIYADGKTTEALAAEGAFGVYAPAIHADPRRLTLINICKGKKKSNKYPAIAAS